MALAALLSSCSFFDNLAESLTVVNEIEMPEKPVAYEMPDVECIADELRNSQWFDYWCSEVLDGNNSVTLAEGLDTEQVKKAIILMRSDYPQIFWQGELFSITSNSFETTIEVPTISGIEQAEIPQMLQEVEKAADEIIDGIPDEWSDYEKVVCVHDYIIENTEYDKIAEKLTRKGISHGIYGCLVEKKAVCMGYASTFQYLMNRLGIECGTCSGSDHAWNYVKIEGEYYWIDTTWDDDDSGSPLHTYCLFTTEQLLNTRTFGEIQPFVPQCTSTETTYIAKNGGFFEVYDEKEIIGYLGENSDMDKCQIMFGSYEEYCKALDELIAKGKAARAIKADKLRYSRIDDMYSIVFILGVQSETPENTYFFGIDDVNVRM